MAIYINRSEYGFNGALPGRTIETDDADYGKILLQRGFEILEAEKETENAGDENSENSDDNSDEKDDENPKSEKKKITKIVK